MLYDNLLSSCISVSDYIRITWVLSKLSSLELLCSPPRFIFSCSRKVALKKCSVVNENIYECKALFRV